MTLANFDASQVTLRKREKALATWKVFNDVKVNTGASVRMEQPSQQSGFVVTLRNQGKVVCGCIPSADGIDASTKYQFNGLSQGTQVNF